jgi:hypothetical protein
MELQRMVTYCDSREQTGLCESEKDASDEKTVVTLDDTHERHHNAPSHHDGGKPNAGTELLEEEVRWHLKGGIGEEEDCEAPVILVGRHVEVLLEAFDLGVSNVST